MSKEVKFEIGEEVKTSYSLCYVVEIETMYGDADGYGQIVIGGFKPAQDEAHMVDLLDTLDRMGGAYPNGRGGGDDYNHVEGFERWFSIENIPKDEYEKLPETIKSLSTDWEYSPDGYGFQASYEGYDIFFYDISGKKFKVDMIDNRKG